MIGGMRLVHVWRLLYSGWLKRHMNTMMYANGGSEARSVPAVSPWGYSPVENAGPASVSGLGQGMRCCDRLGSRLPGTAVQTAGDRQVGQRHHRGLTDADGLAVHEAEEGQHAAHRREPGGFAERAVDDAGGDARQDQAGQDGAAAEEWYSTPLPASWSRPTAAALVPAAPSALSICSLPQAATCGINASTMAGACALGVS